MKQKIIAVLFTLLASVGSLAIASPALAWTCGTATAPYQCNQYVEIGGTNVYAGASWWVLNNTCGQSNSCDTSYSVLDPSHDSTIYATVDWEYTATSGYAPVANFHNTWNDGNWHTATGFTGCLNSSGFQPLIRFSFQKVGHPGTALVYQNLCNNTWSHVND